MSLEISLSSKVDCLCDFTYDFYWMHRGERLSPDNVIPSQEGTSFTYRSLVDELSRGGNVRIRGSAGSRLGSSLGVSLRYFGGSGGPLRSGSIILDGDAGTRTGISMLAGEIYVSGSLAPPYGNIIEVPSDKPGYRKFVSITAMVQGWTPQTPLAPNTFDRNKNTLEIRDGIPRDTIAARCGADCTVIVKGDAGMSTGILMKNGTVRVEGNAGMNTGVLLSGGTVIVGGNAAEFTGTYMRSGIIVVCGDNGSFAGAKMRGGAMLFPKRIKAAGLSESAPADEDVRMLARELGIPVMHAMMFRRYTAAAQFH